LSIAAFCEATSLSHFDYGAAWVLPIAFISDSKTSPADYIILGREAFGNDAGTYDAFGGKRDRAEEKHCIDTAAREFAEEALSHETLGMSHHEVKHYLELAQGNTLDILAIHDLKYHARTVTYITRFSQDSIQMLIKNFPAARVKAHHHHEKEKDALALVKLSDFEQAVQSSSSNSGVTVPATVVNLQGTTSQEVIPLRPIFVRLLRCYVENKPYEAGDDSRIRFYTIGSDSRMAEGQANAW